MGLKCPWCGNELNLSKVATVEEVEPEKPKHPSLTEVEVALGEHAKLVEFSQAGANGVIVVKPKFYLRNDFGKIADKLKQFDARYVSEGKNSRWEI